MCTPQYVKIRKVYVSIAWCMGRLDLKVSKLEFYMTLNSTFLKTSSVLGLVIALSQPAYAMRCVEFIEMDEAGQMEALEAMGGRENARDEAVGADEGAGTDASSDTVELGDPDDENGGRAAARAAAVGSDEELMVVLREECENNPEMDMADLFRDEDESK